MNKVQIELLKTAYAIIDGIPADRFDLGTICSNDRSPKQATNPNHCGTIGCAMGFLAMHPTFNALGLDYKVTGKGDDLEIDMRWKGDYVDYDEAGARLFGLDYDVAEELFRPAFDHERELVCGNDKEVFKMRVRRLLHEETGSYSG